jgi:transcriptional regulator with XRE-family HTH domain
MLNSQPIEPHDPAEPGASPNGELRRLRLHLARNVSAARAAAGLTQGQLAAAAELSRATVHLIEAGAGDPRVSTIAHLARALQLSPVQLLRPGGTNGASANGLSHGDGDRT